MAKHGKKYRAAAAKVNSNQMYLPAEAMKLVKDTAYTKFDATVEVHLRMGLDPRQADQLVRGVVVLPNGLGKTVRVAVFAQGEAAAAARAAGADVVVDDDETFTKIQGGWLEFDVAIATLDLMGKVGRLARILGPRGLMPNPKAGTVIPPEDVARAIKEAKAGRVEFRLDKTANIHVQIGKASFDPDQLTENFGALMEAIKRARPAAAKGNYIKHITLAATMGPGIKVDANAAQAMEAAE
jgi:large subunit ribosomal protein L1